MGTSAQLRFILPFVPVTSILSVRDQCIPDTHQSPIGIKAVILLYQPLVHFWTPENHRFHAVSNCYVTDLMVVNQPHKGSRHGRIRQNKPKQCLYSVAAAVSNQVLWIFTNPTTGSPLQPFLLSKQFLLIKGYPITHDII